MSYDYIIDSSVWIEYFSGSEKGKKSKEIIDQKKIATSIICIAELANKFAREERSFQNHLLFIQSKSAIIPLNISILLVAAEVKFEQRKKKPKFGLADAIQFATAKEIRTILVTTDNDFSDLSGVLLLR